MAEGEGPSKLPPPSYGNVVTILSIDGGGVRGIIPAIILARLEAELQKFDEKARIAEYFDVIAGTSTGGLITAMLTVPNYQSHPEFTAAEIKDFYVKEAPLIFPERSWRQKIFDYFYKPKYDGVHLHKTIQDNVKEKKLHQTLTKVVIPTFDMKLIRPTIFSSFKLKTRPNIDAKLADICIGTTAAPTYFPPHYFKNEDGTEYNLIDGGVLANNPALIAISEVTQEQVKKNPDFKDMEPNDYSKIYLVSLGTGFQKPNKTYDARAADKWGIIAWAKPAVEFALDGSQDLVDYHLASVFKALPADGQENYLRIQTDKLSEQMAELDCATKENMTALEAFAERLLNQPVTRMNLETFKLEPVPGGPTNAEALAKVAKFLYDEKKGRLKNFNANR